MAMLWAPALVAARDTVAFVIDDPRITESSGLARNAAHDGYWTVNDSGDGGVVYALDTKGEVTGSFRYAAEPTDVEALAMYGKRLYVADIGDNAQKREFVTVYFFDDPPTDGSTVRFRSYDFGYPDGESHDAETLLVDGAGRLYIVTKDAKGAIYAAPGIPSRSALNELVKVADAPSYVTDGVFLPTNKRIALRTYVSLLVLDAISYKTTATAAIPLQPQGETIALSRNGKQLLLGTEGRPSTTYQVAVPKKKAKVPTPANTPPPDPSASPSPTATKSADVGDSVVADSSDASADSMPQGTWVALGLAGVVAVAAGVVVALIRRS
jgi:hypothetical protein